MKAILCLAACVVACYFQATEAISITRPCPGLKAATIVPVDNKHPAKACKICEFPCLGLSICLTPMLDTRHPVCPKLSIPHRAEYDTDIHIVKERGYPRVKTTTHLHHHHGHDSYHVPHHHRHIEIVGSSNKE